MEILVISSYELGHQPLGAAWAIAFLEQAGYRPRALDLSVEQLDPSAATDAKLVAFSVPMHTALRVAISAAKRIRAVAPTAHVCFYGHYATLNAEYLLGGIADSVIGGEVEPVLVGLADALVGGQPLHEVAGLGLPLRRTEPHLARLAFPRVARGGLPPLEHYARLEVGGERRTAAAVEASRGCLHHCRHCPIPPVYGGRFFVVPRDVVLADIRALAGRGVAHLTFADPDFFNGPRHSMAIVREMHEEFPELTFDLTTKVEHILEQRGAFHELARCGCLFVVTAVESLSERVLERLAKGHTRRDVFEALGILREAGIAMRPTLVAFTPWTSLPDYLDVLDWVEREQLVEHVDPIQFAIRLLVPPGSLLADDPAIRTGLLEFDPGDLAHPWAHPDARMDRLQRTVSTIVQEATVRGEEPQKTFASVRRAAHAAAGRPPSRFAPARATVAPPRLTEPWFC